MSKIVWHISIFKAYRLIHLQFQLQNSNSFQHSIDIKPILQNNKNLIWSEFLISQQSQASVDAQPTSVSSENSAQTFHYRTQIHLTHSISDVHVHSKLRRSKSNSHVYLSLTPKLKRVSCLGN